MTHSRQRAGAPASHTRRGAPRRRDRRQRRTIVAGRRAAAAVTVALVLTAGCGSDTGPTSSASTPSATPSRTATFPVGAFAAISDTPVSEKWKATLQGALARHDVTGGGGMSATVMTAEGTWSGTTGKADGVRDLKVGDQFSIASITKSVIAAQVMLMVEAGELALDDLASEHLPEGLDFDTNKATVRQLLSHRSGLPDYYDLLLSSQAKEFQRVWTPKELLGLLPDRRFLPRITFAYTETNYLLLKLMIEEVRGRPLGTVLRDGALAGDGLERLIYQPHERPTEPIAVPEGAAHATLEGRGGYLPSLASATAYEVMASDSPTLARWWRALCTGQIVSPASLGEMSTFEPAAHLGSYGLGLYNPANGYAAGFGSTGQLPGYVSWAACLPEEKAVVVVLTNHEVGDGHLAFSQGLGRPLVEALQTR